MGLGVPGGYPFPHLHPLSSVLYRWERVVLVLSRGLGCILSHAIPPFFGHLIFACFFARFFICPFFYSSKFI